jgi:hypothetical protein
MHEKIIPLLAAFSGILMAQEAILPQIAIHTVQTQTISVPPVTYRETRRSPSGNFFFVVSGGWTIHRAVAGASGAASIVTFNLHEIPLLQSSTVTLGEGFDIDAQGNLYVPGSWQAWKGETGARYGIFVFDSRGRYSRLISIPGGGPIYSLAVDNDGNFLASGMDPKYFSSNEEHCWLMRKYSADGSPAGAFSEHPAGRELRLRVGGRPGPDFGEVMSDLRRGRVWVGKGGVYQLFPVSRVVRILDRNGKTVRDVHLIPPGGQAMLRRYQMGGATDGDQIWRLATLDDGTFAVEWLHSETNGNTRSNFRYLALHDATGRSLSSPMPMPPRTILLSGDANGGCYLLRQVDAGTVEAIQAKLSLQ